MRLAQATFTLVMLSLVAASAKADIQFDTESTATQKITSSLVNGGSINLNSAGSQHFTIDLVNGTANVTSAFKGTDFAALNTTFDYNLYNTATTGTVSVSGGNYTVTFMLLFELKITGGAGGLLDGTVFETKDNAIFTGTVGSLPFPDNSVFGDPNRPIDPVAIYLKSDPTGLLGTNGITIGAPIGTSSNRVVTILRSVPEPSTLVSIAIGAGLFGAIGLRKRATRRTFVS